MRFWGALLTLCSILWLALAAPTFAQTGGLNALARLDPAASSVTDRGQGIKVVLAVSQAVPYRVSFMDNPPRLVVDFHEIDFSGATPESADKADHVRELLWGPFLSGWSRMVAVLDIPQRLVSAEETSPGGNGALITLTLAPTTPADFAARIKAAEAEPPPADWALPKAAVVDQPIRRQVGDRPLRVVLDPGHGGIDPGAEAGGTTEAKEMLSFALELAEVLRRAGMTVELTRVNDVFVPLETRISVARAAGADVFLSLHADALAEGEATGATVYKLAKKASDAASAQLAERHDRTDLLAGLDLTASDDEVAGVLMDMARTETGPRADSLAQALATAIQARDIRMHHHPIQEAAFSVLKSADIPSLLLEVGFLSSAKDRERLADPVWRASMADAILAALQGWAMTDAAEARLLRQ
jgi:N-acetylmuramoyl-L-alanine amidase